MQNKILRKIRTCALKLLLLCGSILVVLLLTEIALHLFQGAPPTQSQGTKSMEYDALLGWRKVAHLERHIEMPEFRSYEKINSRGIRGPEYTYEKEPGEYRILILGDSFAHGVAVNFEELFSEQLKRLLNEQGQTDRRYEVINTGTTGYSTDQEWLYYQHEGIRYQPDLTILMFYENDPWYNIQPFSFACNAPKPVFTLADGNLTLKKIDPKNGAAEVFAPPPPPPARSLAAAKMWLCDNSRVYKLFREGIKSSYPLHKLALRLGLAHVIREEVMTDEKGRVIPRPRTFGCWQPEYSPEIQTCWDVTAALLVQMKKQARSIGSEFIVFNIPPKTAVYPKTLEGTRRQFGIPDDWHPDQVGTELKRICRRYEIDIIEPTERFKSEAHRLADRNEALYFQKDGHWNVQGHSLAARVMAEQIKTEQEIPLRVASENITSRQ